MESYLEGYKMKKPKNIKHKLKIAGIILIILFFVFQLFLDYAYFWRLLATDSGPILLVTDINKAIDNIDKPAPIDPITGKIYLTGSNLFLPANSDNNGTILYNYWDGGQIQITTKSIIGQAQASLFGIVSKSSISLPWQWNYSNNANSLSKVEDETPNLQSCLNAIILQYTSELKDFSGPGKLIASGSKKLANGKTIYFFKNSQCNVTYQIDLLMKNVKQIQSY